MQELQRQQSQLSQESVELTDLQSQFEQDVCASFYRFSFNQAQQKEPNQKVNITSLALPSRPLKELQSSDGLRHTPEFKISPDHLALLQDLYAKELELATLKRENEQLKQGDKNLPHVTSEQSLNLPSQMLLAFRKSEKIQRAFKRELEVAKKTNQAQKEQLETIREELSFAKKKLSKALKQLELQKQDFNTQKDKLLKQLKYQQQQKVQKSRGEIEQKGQLTQSGAIFRNYASFREQDILRPGKMIRNSSNLPEYITTLQNKSQNATSVDKNRPYSNQGLFIDNNEMQRLMSHVQKLESQVNNYEHSLETATSLTQELKRQIQRISQVKQDEFHKVTEAHDQQIKKLNLLHQQQMRELDESKNKAMMNYEDMKRDAENLQSLKGNLRQKQNELTHYQQSLAHRQQLITETEQLNTAKEIRLKSFQEFNVKQSQRLTEKESKLDEEKQKILIKVGEYNKLEIELTAREEKAKLQTEQIQANQQQLTKKKKQVENKYQKLIVVDKNLKQKNLTLLKKESQLIQSENQLIAFEEKIKTHNCVLKNCQASIQKREKNLVERENKLKVQLIDSWVQTPHQEASSFQYSVKTLKLYNNGPNERSNQYVSEMPPSRQRNYSEQFNPDEGAQTAQKNRTTTLPNELSARFKFKTNSSSILKTENSTRCFHCYETVLHLEEKRQNEFASAYEQRRLINRIYSGTVSVSIAMKKSEIIVLVERKCDKALQCNMGNVNTAVINETAPANQENSQRVQASLSPERSMTRLTQSKLQGSFVRQGFYSITTKQLSPTKQVLKEVQQRYSKERVLLREKIQELQGSLRKYEKENDRLKKTIVLTDYAPNELESQRMLRKNLQQQLRKTLIDFNEVVSKYGSLKKSLQGFNVNRKVTVRPASIQYIKLPSNIKSQKTYTAMQQSANNNEFLFSNRSRQFHHQQWISQNRLAGIGRHIRSGNFEQNNIKPTKALQKATSLAKFELHSQRDCK